MAPAGDVVRGWPRPAVRAFVNVAYAAVLVVLALLPGFPSGTPSIPDSWAHAGAYGIQAMLVYWAMVTVAPSRLAVLAAFASATMFGGVTEALQLAQPARSVELRDVFANAVGAALACALAATVHGIRSRRP